MVENVRVYLVLLTYHPTFYFKFKRVWERETGAIGGGGIRLTLTYVRWPLRISTMGMYGQTTIHFLVRTFKLASAIIDIGARSDIAADGFWGGHFEKTFFDVRVLNSLAPSNTTPTPSDCYRRHEKESNASGK